MATFRKDSKTGNWNVFGPASEVKRGNVTVRKADGTTKTVCVAHVSKPFDVNGTPHVYGYLAETKREPAQASSGSGGRCAECGGYGARTLCTDSSGIQGYCCGRCARLSRYERSFA